MKLGKGINYSRFCWQWRGTESKDLNDYMDGTNLSGTNFISQQALLDTKNHIALIKKMGFDTVRLPITFHCWSRFDNNIIDSQHPYWAVLDTAIDACNINNLNLVISYHHAPTMNLDRVRAGWQSIALHTDGKISDKVVFEIFSEPNEKILNSELASNYTDVIHTIRNILSHRNRFIIVGGNQFNDIGFDDNGNLGGLRGFEPLNLPNIIYTFHYYAPKVFTNQGFSVEPCYQTTRISYPFKSPLPAFVGSPNCLTTNNFNLGVFEYENYDKAAGNDFNVPMGSDDFTQIYFTAVKRWATVHSVDIWCGEWGFHRDLRIVPNDDSIERYTQMMINNFNDNGIDWCWWDFEGPFTLFNPVPDVANSTDSFGLVDCQLSNLAPSMRKILGLNSEFSFKMSDRIIRNSNPLIKSKTHRLTFSWKPIDEIDVLKYEVIGHRVTVIFSSPPLSIPIPTFTPFVLTTKNKGSIPYSTSFVTNNQFELLSSNFFLRIHKTDLTFIDISVE